MTTFRNRSRGRRASMVALSASLALAVSAVVGCGSDPPPPPTAKVERGTVATRVSASGALAAVTSQNLGFPKGAQLKEVAIKVGDRVAPGQLLARLDDFAFQQMLNQQQAQLNNQQAQLDRLVNGNTVEQADRSLDQAREILSATQRNVDAQLRLDRTTIDRAQVALDDAQRQRQQAERNLEFCRSHQTGTSRGVPVTPGMGGVVPTPTPMPQMRGDGRRDRDGVLGGDPDNYYGTNEGGADPCSAQVSALNSARTAHIQARTTLEQARKQKTVDETQGRVSIENARQSVVSAQNNRDTAGNDAPANIDAQRALVADAQAAVALAQKDVENTVLFAPVAGTVTVINGAVGEFLGAAQGTTPLAPGSTAAIPGVGAAATSGQNTTTSGTNTRTGDGSFIVLGDVNTYQVIVPFEESDAAKIAPNQPVEVTFDALPDLVRRATVAAIAPTGTDISGVTNYYATIVLTETDPRLRDGQTAEAAVLTNSVDNVLTVPNAAVTQRGGGSFVTIPGPDGQPTQTPFQPGVVGDDRTQVLSGLTEGQQILLPQAQVTPTPDGGGGPGN